MKFLLALGFVVGSAHAVERVTAFHSDIRIAPGGELTVTETIEVQAEGKQIRGGIQRDFPTDYRDAKGNRVSVPFEVLSVTRNGASEPYQVERVGDGARVRMGTAAALLPNGKHVYELAYRTSRHIAFFEKHDELYWNVNGTGWSLAFDRLTAEVHFTTPVPAADIRVEAYTGPQGARGHDFNAFVREGSAAFRASRPLAAREGMTIVVGFPKGVVAQPTVLKRSGWLVQANPGIAVGSCVFALMLAFLFACWWRYGRDPAAGPAFPRYEPPEGLGPAGVRFLDNHGYDERCLAAALLGLGSRGYLRIQQAGERFRVQRTDKEQVSWFPGEQALARALFAHGTPHVDIEKRPDRAVQAARDEFSQELMHFFARKRYSSNNALAAIAAAAIGGIGVLAMIALETSALPMALIAGAMAVAVVVFAWKLLPVYSVLGRAVHDEINGLRRYLSVAEADELRRMKAPPQTKAEFSRFLPYAVALGVEKTWAARFASVDADYYQCGSDGLDGFSSSLATMRDTLAAAATAPDTGDRARGQDPGPVPSLR